MDFMGFDIFLLSPALFCSLLVINCVIPAILQNKYYEVTAFRYFLYFSPAVITVSWTLILKSLLLGLAATTVWKSYYDTFPIPESPNSFWILWIALELGMLCLNQIICLVFSNCEFILTPNVVYLVLFVKCYAGPAWLIFFRPSSYYLPILDVEIIGFTLNEFLVLFLAIVYTCLEYMSIIHHKQFEMEFNDTDISNMTFCAIANIVGRFMASILTKDLPGRNISLHYAHFIQVLGSALLLQMLPRKLAACTYNQKATFAEIETLIPMLLMGFGDACYSRYYDNLSIEFMDRSAEAMFLVKYGQMVIIGAAALYSNVGYNIAFALFVYLCTLNINVETPIGAPME